jgi:hypothetical protein
MLFPSLLTAQGSSPGVVQYKLPATARTAAVGESFIADAGHLGSVGLNPANLFRLERGAILLTHAEWIQDLRSDYVTFASPVSFGTVGLGISHSTIGDIEIRDKPGPAIATFSARTSTVQFSAAAAVSASLALGATAKLLYEKLYIDEATGIGVDFGLLYRTPVEGLVAGVSFTNWGGTSALAREPIDLPRQMAIGASYRFDADPLTLTAASRIVRESTIDVTRFSTGVDIVFQREIALRIGYQSGYDARSITAGFGLFYGVLSFDYAYVPFTYTLGTAHLFTLGLTI